MEQQVATQTSRFLDLPVELQRKIIKFALPGVTVPNLIPPRPGERRKVSIDESIIQQLRLVCHQFDDLVQDARPYFGDRIPRTLEGTGYPVGTGPSPRPVFWFRPPADVLDISGGIIPGLRRRGETQTPETLPVRRLTDTSFEGPTFDECRRMKNEYLVDGDYTPMPLPSMLPDLQEFNNVFLVADCDDWSIPAATLYRGMETRRPPGQPPDTGIEWRRPAWAKSRQRYSPQDRYLDTLGKPPNTIAYNGHAWICTRDGPDTQPRVVIGGHWLGFRYHEETGQVWAAALNFDDVWPLVKGPTVEEPRYGSYPHMVWRTWIIRKGEQAPRDTTPHNWLRLGARGISRDDDFDPECAEQLECIWARICQGMRDLRIQDEKDENLVVVSSGGPRIGVGYDVFSGTFS